MLRFGVLIKMNSYNCPNCGAVITKDVCDYCGTVIHDFSCLKVGEPSYIKVKYGDKLILGKMVVNDCAINIETIDTKINTGKMYIPISFDRIVSLNINGHMIEDVDGTLFKVIET